MIHGQLEKMIPGTSKTNSSLDLSSFGNSLETTDDNNSARPATVSSINVEPQLEPTSKRENNCYT